MEINTLLESSNNYKSMQADASRLAEKWQASGLLEGIEDKKYANNTQLTLAEDLSLQEQESNGQE